MGDMKILTIISTLTLALLISGCNSAHARQIAPHRVAIQIKTDAQHGRFGPDGKWHDAFLPANFHLTANQPNTITVTNSDDMPHTLTSPTLKVNLTIPANGSASVTVTPKPGTYLWFCALPCDPWAMSHDGYMRGHILAA